jgi:uncharacterized protein RhaS with RHS repeats
LGRFISEDPIGFGGGDVNLFGYVRNRPLIYRDSLGLYPGNDIVTATTQYASSPEFFEAANFVANDPHARRAIVTTAAAGYGVAQTGGATALAYGATSVGAASAGTVGAVVIGGFTVSYVPTYYLVGKPLSEASWNPVVNGSLNPFGKSAAEVEKEKWTPQKPSSGCSSGGGNGSVREPGEKCQLDSIRTMEETRKNGGIRVCVYRCKNGEIKRPKEIGFHAGECYPYYPYP